jgi:uncharacterized protein (TIGR03118 family)
MICFASQWFTSPEVSSMILHTKTRRAIFARAAVLAALAFLSIAVVAPAFAQYTLTSLVTTSQDPNLVNGWGMAYATGGPFWIADEGPGKSTVYNATGGIVPLVVTVPPAVSGKGHPTGLVANSTTGFVISQNGNSGPANFIFATMDGTISGWNSSVNANSAVIAVNNHATANYTGLTIATVGANTFIYACNQAKNQIEIYDSTFTLTSTFTDTTLTGLKVYGVQAINGKIYVTFDGSAGGAVDIFSPSGKLIRLLTKNGSKGPLLAPWAVALAPSTFGTFSGDLLVGNVNNGQIHAVNPKSGKVVGVLKDTTGKVITIPGLWALLFGGGSVANNGNTNQLFFAAGTSNYKTGEFGVINP